MVHYVDFQHKPGRIILTSKIADHVSAEGAGNCHVARAIAAKSE